MTKMRKEQITMTRERSECYFREEGKEMLDRKKKKIFPCRPAADG